MNFSYAFVMSHGDLRLIIAYTENILKKCITDFS